MNALLPLAHIAPAGRHGREIIVVGFAGGGGSCEGIKMALGRSPEEALNHDPQAVAMHAANHPETRHWCQNIWQADPSAVAAGRPIGLAWFSPDCKHFSKAKGGAPRARNVRDLAWVVVVYAKLPRHIRPRVLMIENVEEFQTWAPLLPDGQPDQTRKGETFRKWVGELKRLGYRVEYREERACDFGTPTIRKRLYIIARCDGEPIVWPEPTHGPKRAQPWRTAAEIIDWSLPCPSIFERTKPLADATLRRIATGTMRYVVNAAEPFIVKPNHTASYYNTFRGQPIGQPLQTVTAEPGFALVAPSLAKYHGSKSPGDARMMRPDEPIKTIDTSNRHALVAAFLAKHYSGVIGHGPAQPIGTVTTADHHSVVAANLTHFYSSAPDGGNGDLRTPIKTVTSGGQGGQDQDVRSPLHTVPTVDRFGLVTVTIAGEPYVLTDIGMRMLSPRELFRAQGFPDSYRIDIEVDGKRLSKAAQVRMCGNSVCPPVAAALVRANVPELAVTASAVAAE